CALRVAPGNFQAARLTQTEARREFQQRLARGQKNSARAQPQRAPAQNFVETGDAAVLAHHPRFDARALGERKNVEGEPFARKQPEKPGQLGEARLLVVPFVAVVVVVILRRRAEPGPEIVEARRGAREFELEAAELDVAGLLG